MATKKAAKKAPAKKAAHTKSVQSVDAMEDMNKLPPHDGPPHEGDPADIKVAEPVKTGRKMVKPPTKKLSTEERLERVETLFRTLKAKLRKHGIHIEGLDGETV